jgi:hypothetical protein
MIDTRTQERFSRDCSDAMFGFVAAASAAYSEVFQRSMGIWSDALSSMVPTPPEPRSWYRHPDHVSPPFPLLPLVSAPTRPSTPLEQWSAVMTPWLALAAASPRSSTMPWLGPWALFVDRRAAAAWPMAFFMIAVGVPRSVAVPAAEANAALFDATVVAKQALSRAFSAYRSESGHATTHVVFENDSVAMTALFPLRGPSLLH